MGAVGSPRALCLPTLSHFAPTPVYGTLYNQLCSKQNFVSCIRTVFSAMAQGRCKVEEGEKSWMDAIVDAACDGVGVGQTPATCRPIAGVVGNSGENKDESQLH